MRTTISIDDAIMAKLKRLKKREGKSLGRLVSDLLAQSMALAQPAVDRPLGSAWISKPMGALVDVNDCDAMLDAADGLPP